MSFAALPSDAADRTLPPPALLPYQQRWVADNSALKVCEKSRRIGITWAEAASNVLAASAAGGTNVFYIGPTEDMALEYIEACAMWARAFDAAASEIEDGLFDDLDEDGNTRNIKSYRITFPGSGRRIVALSSRPTNLRGKQGVIVIDEAAFHPDLRQLLKAAMAMLLWGDSVHVLSTHNGADSEFNELIQQIRAGSRKGSVHRIPFRDAVEEGLYRRVCLRRKLDWSPDGEAQWTADAYGFYGDDAAEELDVVPSQSAGVYLTMQLIEDRMSASTPLVRGKWTPTFGELPEAVRTAEVAAWIEEELAPHLDTLDRRRPHGFGEDFGRVADLTTIDLIEEGRDLVNRVKLHVELSCCPFRQQEQILFFMVDRCPNLRGGALDATGNGAYLAEVAAQRYGASRIEQVKLSDSFYLDHMPRFKAALQDATLTDLPRDAQVRDDLRALRVVDGIPKLPKAATQKADGDKLRRHGDGAISLFLGHYAMKREWAPIAWSAGPTKTERWLEGATMSAFPMRARQLDVAERSFGKGGAW